MYSECIATCKAFLFELAQESYSLELYLVKPQQFVFHHLPQGFFCSFLTFQEHFLYGNTNYKEV